MRPKQEPYAEVVQAQIRPNVKQDLQILSTAERAKPVGGSGEFVYRQVKAELLQAELLLSSIQSFHRARLENC